MRPLVYIAGPISLGDQGMNIRNGMLMWHILWSFGFAPFCPHWTHLQHLLTPLDYEEWMEFDFIWLEQCQAVFRMPGESPGSDRGVAHALKIGLPVFFDVQVMVRELLGKEV